MKEEFVKELDDAIAKHALLDHPFYQMWNKGELPMDALKEYSKQYYSHVRAFPRYLGACYAQCDDVEVRQLLLENMCDEDMGGLGLNTDDWKEKNHPELWLRFVEGLGVPREDAVNSTPLPSTVESVENMKELTNSEDYLEGVAALYAYESQVPEVAKTKRTGLAKFYNLDNPKAVEFFTVHEEADLIHRKIEQDMLVKGCKTEESRKRIIDAAESAAKALYGFLDGVYDAYIEPSKCCNN